MSRGLSRGGPFFLPALLWLACALPAKAQTFELSGRKSVVLHARDGARVPIGAVTFRPLADGGASFELALDHSRFTDHFLSMREFKCLPGNGEILCHVPYPYPRPSTVHGNDFAWLEHALLFLFKLPSEFGAKLWNGVYFRMSPVGATLVGLPQAVDLNLIGAPPARTDVPPYKPALRDDIRPGTRWFERLTIE